MMPRIVRHACSTFVPLVAATTLATPARAQDQLERIPTLVARASYFGALSAENLRFFDGMLPQGWPAALVPPNARVIGGSTIGDSIHFGIRIAVFSFAPGSNPAAAVQRLLEGAGFAKQDSPIGRRAGGFMPGGPAGPGSVYCSATHFAVGHPVDSVGAPGVWAMALLEGEAASSNCRQRERAFPPTDLPPRVPTLTPPPGVLQFARGRSGSEEENTESASLRTTLSPDSLLAHYGAQLAAGGWKADGRAAIAERVAAQHFTVRDGDADWTGLLLVHSAGSERRIQLVMTKR